MQPYGLVINNQMVQRVPDTPIIYDPVAGGAYTPAQIAVIGTDLNNPTGQWFPITDVHPSLNTQLASITGQTTVINPVGCTITVTDVITPFPLAQVQQNQINSILAASNKAQAALVVSYNGHPLRTGMSELVDILFALVIVGGQIAAGNPVTTVFDPAWSFADGFSGPMLYSDIQALPGVLAQAGLPIKTKSATLIAQIMAATTVDAVLAITWS